MYCNVWTVLEISIDTLLVLFEIPKYTQSFVLLEALLVVYFGSIALFVLLEIFKDRLKSIITQNISTASIINFKNFFTNYKEKPIVEKRLLSKPLPGLPSFCKHFLSGCPPFE